MKRRNFIKRIGAIILSTMVTLPVGPLQNIMQNTIFAASPVTVSEKVQDGVMLHAFNWSFNTIKAKLPEIAAAGYTGVQVSPVQGTKDSTKDASKWWILYQPTNQSIGNAQLGTKDEFAALCQEADKYGIKIIVDAVMNHMANNGDQNSWSGVVDPAFDRYDFYHNLGQCTDWNNRWAVTQQGIGMPDLNTQSSEVQAKASAFLNECIACGADGFRFDAAKHIETNRGADSGQSWQGSYWDNVLGSLNNKDNIFLYGEILQGGADNLGAYTSYMRITDHSYGWTLREAVANKNLYSIGDYNTGMSASNLVSYFENHDTYEDGNSTWLTDYERKMCWGILAARANVAPLLLSRPAGTIGEAGEELWKNQEVVAVNFFHNAMAGQGEYIRYPRQETVMIDRGTKGTAIINTSDSFYLNSPTNLADGNYTDKAGSGATFNVSGGYITGQVPGGRIVVIGDYVVGETGSGDITNNSNRATTSPEKPVIGEAVTVKYDATGTTLDGSGEMLLHWGYDGWLTSEDVQMNQTGTNKWEATITVPSEATSTLDFVFTNGTGWDNNSSNDWHVALTESQGEEDPLAAYFVKPSDWSDQVNIYVYDESGSTVKEVAQWPGVAMTNEGNNLYSYTLPEGWDEAQVIFNDGNNQVPGANQSGYVLKGTMIYDNGNWSTYTVSDEDNDNDDDVTSSKIAYFDNASYNWSQVYIYAYDESGDTVKENAAWPGVLMTNEGNNIYSYVAPEEWEDVHVIFTDGNGVQIPGSTQTGFSLTGSMIYSNGNWTVK
nr:starch-binding protein [uncultured Cellulosilyticum sp.]